MKSKVQNWKWFALPRVFAITLIALFVVVGYGPPATLPNSSQHEDRVANREGISRTANHYDLSRDEERGGHTLQRHVARTDTQLHERLQRERNISAASTWTDLETAECIVAEALAAEHGRVDNWMRRGYPRANLALHYNARRVIGRSLRRAEDATEDCTSAVIVLRADGPDRFYVLTTYPEARE